MDETLSYEDTIAKHRKERKEMLAITQKMKHSVSKGDKKRKKEINIKIAKMLADLDLKQSDELKMFPEQERNFEMESLDPMRGGTSTEESSSDCTPNQSQNSSTTTDNDSPMKDGSPRISKAEKRRIRKSEQAKEREKAIQEQDDLNLSGIRSLEMSLIAKKLAERELVLHEIPSDGNCLYHAIEHQLSILNLQKLSMKSLRTSTASYLRTYKEEFLPFLVNSDGDCFSDVNLDVREILHCLKYFVPHSYSIAEQFDKYCDDIANTSAWGGHVEVQILSRVCGRAIEIIQAEGPSIICGNMNDFPKLIISYHRHAYGLGEHYNSVVPRSLKI